MSDNNITTPAAAPLLKSFDPRPLLARGKFVLTLVGVLVFAVLGALEITVGHGSPEILERIIMWLGLTITGGLGVIGVDDALTKPTLARALERLVTAGGKADAPPPG